MKIIHSLFFLFISILHAEDKQASVFQQQLAHLESLNVDPTLKVGADDLKEVLTHVWGQVLPSIPVSAPDWADQFYANYSTLKFPYLFERAKRDAARYLAEVATYYPGYMGDGIPNKDNNLHILLPGYQYPQSQLLIDQVQEMLNAHPGSMTCLEYLIFTANLTLKLPEHNKKLSRQTSDRAPFYKDIEQYFFNSGDKKFLLPFPMHTGTQGFDGIFGELMILHSMSLGIMPIMYVARPNCVADEDLRNDLGFYGPIQCYVHDILHWADSIKHPYTVSQLGTQLTNFTTKSSIETVFHFVHESNYQLNRSYTIDYLKDLTGLIIDYYANTQINLNHQERIRIDKNFKDLLGALNSKIKPNAQILLAASKKSDDERNVFVQISNILSANWTYYMQNQHLFMAEDLYAATKEDPKKISYGLAILQTNLCKDSGIFSILIRIDPIYQGYLQGKDLKQAIIDFCQINGCVTTDNYRVSEAIKKMAPNERWMYQYLNRCY